MKLERFTIKDIIFIAILSAALTLAGLLTMPLVMSVTLFGLRNMTSALVYPIFVILGIMKIKKMGTLTLMGILHGSVLIMMAPVMFWSIFLAALLSELITYLIYRNYEKDKAKILAATLFIPMTLPFTLIFTMLINGKNLGEIIEKPFLSVAVCAVTVVISYLSTKIGEKLGRELQKAGKL